MQRPFCVMCAGAVAGVSEGAGRQAEGPGGQHAGWGGHCGLPGAPHPQLPAGAGGPVGEHVSPVPGSHLGEL